MNQWLCRSADLLHLSSSVPVFISQYECWWTFRTSRSQGFKLKIYWLWTLDPMIDMVSIDQQCWLLPPGLLWWWIPPPLWTEDPPPSCKTHQHQMISTFNRQNKVLRFRNFLVRLLSSAGHMVLTWSRRDLLTFPDSTCLFETLQTKFFDSQLHDNKRQTVHICLFPSRVSSFSKLENKMDSAASCFFLFHTIIFDFEWIVRKTNHNNFLHFPLFAICDNVCENVTNGSGMLETFCCWISNGFPSGTVFHLMNWNVPLLLFELIGQFLFVFLRGGQKGSDLLEVLLILRHVLWAAGTSTLEHFLHRFSFLRLLLIPARVAPWGRSAPSPPRRCGWWPWPSRLAPGHALPAAARCAAASPSGLLAAPWCLRSSERSVTTSPSAGRGRMIKFIS